MAIPDELFNYLGSSVEAISKVRQRVKWFLSTLKAFPHPFAFIRYLRYEQPNLTRQEAGVLYRITRYFAEPWRYLNKIPGSQAIDPLLSNPTIVYADVYNPERSHKYNVETTLFNPAIGEYINVNTWVQSGVPLTPIQIYTRSIATLREYIARGKGSPPFTEEALTQVLSQSIVGYRLHQIGE